MNWTEYITAGIIILAVSITAFTLINIANKAIKG